MKRETTIQKTAIACSLLTLVIAASAGRAQLIVESGQQTSGALMGPQFPQPVTAAICGANDNRVQLARDSRLGIGRITASYAAGAGNCPDDFVNGCTSTCTGFILSNGVVLTAGHCVDTDNDEVIDSEFLAGQIEFNVPDSTFSGCQQIDSATRIYPILSVVDFQFIRVLGADIATKDWAVFSVGTDASGNPVGAVEGFLRPEVALPLPGTNITVTGYGGDTHPNNGNPCQANSSSETLQTESGLLVFAALNEIAYKVDTEGGDSGGPIIRTSNGRALGIHNTSLCEVEVFNSGVAFTKDNLADAVNSFQGSDAVHLDAAIGNGGDGTALAPFNELDEAVSAVSAGGKLVVVTGSYSGSATIDKEVEFVLPVGGVTFGD
jgi:V8-like Glu-specific endopeptidase